MTLVPTYLRPSPQDERSAQRRRLCRLARWCAVAVVLAALVFSGPSDAAVTTW